MYQEFYRGSLLLDLPLFSLVFFAAFFACTVAWIFFFNGEERFERAARLPLADGDDTHE